MIIQQSRIQTFLLTVVNLLTNHTLTVNYNSHLQATCKINIFNNPCITSKTYRPNSLIWCPSTDWHKL